MTQIARALESCKRVLDFGELERLGEWKEKLQDKIERGFWCLNLLLLDGLDCAELEALRREVSDFSAACASWRQGVA